MVADRSFGDNVPGGPTVTSIGVALAASDASKANIAAAVQARYFIIMRVLCLTNVNEDSMTARFYYRHLI
jgi:hypothetical protein